MTCRCGNEARYINARGELTCSLCPLREGVDSIRIVDVPRLLAWAREHVRKGEVVTVSCTPGERWVVTQDPQELREIIGRPP